MDVREILAKSLEESQRYLDRALDGLTPEEAAWAPGDECNSIAFILWHMTRAEDMWINRVIRREPEIYEAGFWPRKLGTPTGDTGNGYSAEQVRKWPVPKLSLLREYSNSVREVTLATIKITDDDQMFKTVGASPFANTIGSIYAHVITEEALHVGQIAYLRGIRRGIEDSHH